MINAERRIQALVPAPLVGRTMEQALTAIADHIEALHELADYAQHDSWRCDHADRFLWEPDCPCGLSAALRKAGHPGAGN